MAVAIPFIAAGLSAAAAIKQSQAQQAEAKTAQNMAEYSAKLAEQERTVVQQQAATNEETSRRRSRQILGQIRAGALSSGAGLTGSSMDVYRQSVEEAEMDALNVRYGGQLQSTGLTQSADLARAQGAQYGNIARKAKGASILNTASAAFSGYTGGGGNFGG